MNLTFKNVLKNIRINCYRCQRTFAQEIGVPIGTYPAWERGACLPNAERLGVICKKLKTVYNISDKDIEKLLNAYKRDKKGLWGIDEL